MKWWPQSITKRALMVMVAVLVVSFAIALQKQSVTGAMAADWRTARRDSAGIAPDPLKVREAVVQVYAARAFSWRGYLGVHTWISVKPANAKEFSVYEVVGWRVMHDQPALSISNRPADGRWFGAIPELLVDLRGQGVDDIIRRIDIAARNYRYMDQYRIWPGPNSNTFTAEVGRAVPELKLDLPATAIGKDFLPDGDFVAGTPSGTGYQVSLYGLLGLMVAREEGLELNVLGLTFGIDPTDLSLKLPFAGRVGF